MKRLPEAEWLQIDALEADRNACVFRRVVTIGLILFAGCVIAGIVTGK